MQVKPRSSRSTASMAHGKGVFTTRRIAVVSEGAQSKTKVSVQRTNSVYRAKTLTRLRRHVKKTGNCHHDNCQTYTNYPLIMKKTTLPSRPFFHFLVVFPVFLESALTIHHHEALDALLKATVQLHDGSTLLLHGSCHECHACLALGE